MKVESGNKKRVGFVTLIGRPSTGKSTLLNAILEEKVSIVSQVPQTTRRHIRGIYQDDDSQIIFLDTPGFHDSDKKFNQALLGQIHGCLKETDLIVYLIDVTRKFGEEEEKLLELLQKHKEKLFIVFNKRDVKENFNVDLFKKERLENFSDCPILFISALESDGVKELVMLLKEKLPEQDHLYYPEDYYTDQPVDLRISEIVREKIFEEGKDEIPHSTFVQIDDIEDEEDGRKTILGTIYVESNSQKPILIGKGGTMIKKISQRARKDLEKIFDCKIFLRLNVKVWKKWRKDPHLLKKLLH